MRLIWWVGAFTAGIAAAFQSGVRPAVLAMLAPLPLAAVYVLVRRSYRTWAEGLLACYIGLYVGGRAIEPAVLPAAVSTIIDAEDKALLQGWVSGGPEPADNGAGGARDPGASEPSPSRLRIDLERVNGIAARATLSVSVAAGAVSLLPGDAVELRARLRSLRGLANPGLPDTALQARANGLDAVAGVGAAGAIRRLSDSEIHFPRRYGLTVLRLAARVRVALGRAIDDVASGAAAAFLHTAVLGERRQTDPKVEEGFRAAGATHVLSVSGLHLAAVGLVFFDGLRRLLVRIPVLPLWIEPRRLAAVIAMPAIAFYTLVTGSAVATVRSTLMMLVGLVGLAIGRPGTPLVAVAAAVLLLLGWTPLVVADVSFQLSAVSVVALAVLVPRLAPRRPNEGAALARGAPGLFAPPMGGGAMRGLFALAALVGAWLGGFVAVSVAAGATTAPIVAHHFGEVTPAAPLGNLLLVPLVELVTVPFGLGGAALGAMLGRRWAYPFLKVAQGASWLALAIADQFRKHAPVWLTRAPDALETEALCIGVACLLAGVRAGPVLRRRLVVAGTGLVLAAGTSMTEREIARRCSGDLMVTFLDVGQGDAAVLQLPGGATVLIDAGGTYDGSFDPGARVVEPFLRARGITHLDAVALSHPHPDHMGGLHRILARFPVDALWTSGDDGHNPDYRRLISEARARGISLPVPGRWERGGAVLDPLGPFVVDGKDGNGSSEHIGAPEGTTVNDASLVIRASYRGRSVLFTGDLEANGEGELAGRTTLGQSVASDVLKVPHHGSRTSSTNELLDAARPRIAIMSLGWKNRFHFPRPEVVGRYVGRGIRLFRTDLDGAVTITLGGGGEISATCVRGCR